MIRTESLHAPNRYLLALAHIRNRLQVDVHSSRGVFGHRQSAVAVLDPPGKAGRGARFARRTKDGNCRLATVKDPAGAMHVYLQAISDLSHAEEITIQSV